LPAACGEYHAAAAHLSTAGTGFGCTLTTISLACPAADRRGLTAVVKAGAERSWSSGTNG
jgi:hypothetical protein